MTQKLMAVWAYDMPPYLMAGEVATMRCDGGVTVKGYGNKVFMPTKILPYDADRIEALRELQREYYEREKNLKLEYHNKARKLFFIEKEEI